MNQNLIPILPAQTLRAVTRLQQKTWLTIAAAALVSASSLSASVYVSTVGNPLQVGGAGVGFASWTGVNFTTDTELYTLDEITVGLFIPNLHPGSWNLHATLYEADANGLPTTPINTLTFTRSALSFGEQLVTFTPDSAFQLTADTSYTFVLAPEDLEVAFVWRTTPSFTGFHTDVPGSTWQMDPVIAQSFNSGGHWGDLSGGHFRLIAEISATPVPEPSTWALLIASGAGLFWRQRRRRA